MILNNDGGNSFLYSPERLVCIFRGEGGHASKLLILKFKRRNLSTGKRIKIRFIAFKDHENFHFMV